MPQSRPGAGCVRPPVVPESRLLYAHWCVGLHALHGWLGSPAVAVLDALMDGGDPQYGRLQ